MSAYHQLRLAGTRINTPKGRTLPWRSRALYLTFWMQADASGRVSVGPNAKDVSDDLNAPPPYSGAITSVTWRALGGLSRSLYLLLQNEAGCRGSIGLTNGELESVAALLWTTWPEIEPGIAELIQRGWLRHNAACGTLELIGNLDGDVCEVMQ